MPPDPPETPGGAALRAGWDARSMAFWPALPIIAAQGLWLRRRAYRAPPASGIPEGTVGDGPPLRLLALGDSIIAGVGIERIDDALPGAFARALARRWGRRVTWTACGRNGANVAGARRLFAAVRADTPPADIVLLSIGVNDTTGLSGRQRFLDQLGGLYAELRRHSPQALLLHAGIPPLQAFPLLPTPLRQLLGLRAAQMDRMIPRALAAHAPGLHRPFDALPAAHQFAADGFHPDAGACAEWAEGLVDGIPAPGSSDRAAAS